MINTGDPEVATQSKVFAVKNDIRQLLTCYGPFLCFRSFFLSTTQPQNKATMALPLRVATAASVSRITMPKNPTFISLLHSNCTLKFHNSPSLRPRPNALPTRSHLFIRAISEATVEPEISKKQKNDSPKDWKIKMLYDGDCPLCMREVLLYLFQPYRLMLVIRFFEFWH